ncbi:MAG: hypothetical protein ACUVS2_01965 [Candidatus Flexifilum sp.]
MTSTARPPLADVQHTLSGLVARWEHRLRTVQTIRWLPVALLIGTLGGIGLALGSRLRPLLGRDALIAAAAGLLILSAGVLLALIWLPRRTLIQSARRFDLLLDLDERISTAAELLTGRIHAPDALIAAQVTDAREAGRAARARDRLPMRHDRRAWLALIAALIALALLIALPNPQENIIAAEAAEQAAIEAARAALREITGTIATEAGLTDEERADLLQILETNRVALQQPNITPEEALAAVSDVRSALQATADRVNRRLTETAQALQAASAALSGGTPGADGASLEQSLEAVRDQMGQLAGDPSAGAALAQRLEAAAEALAAVNPAAAQALRDAASALRSGDTGAAQAALDRAGAALEQQAAQQAQGTGTPGALDRSARTAGDVAQSLRQASAAPQGGQPQAGVEGEQQTDPAAPGQPAAAQGSAAQQGAEQQDTVQQGGAQGQQGAEGQQSQQGAAASPGDQAGQQGAGGGQGQEASIAGNGQQPGADQPAGLNAGLNASAIAQAGDGAASAGQDDPAGQQRSGPIDADNNPDGLGERAYEPVYAPRRIGGQPDGPNLFLEPDAGDAPLIEGEFAPNAAGESVVPYDQVFAQYQQAANAALDSGRVPLALRDIIRSYFSALEPRR